MADSRGLEAMVVEQVTFGGKGLVRLPTGKVCFVPGVIPGERVELNVRTEKSSYAEADLVRIVEASPFRVKPECPVFGSCGGCQYQHISYERQLALKAEQVADAMKRIGGLANAPVEPAVASPKPYHYRNRITVHAANGRVGFFGRKSRKVVDVVKCFISSDEVNALLTELRKSRPRDGEYPLREPGEFRGFRQVNDGAAALLLEVVRGMCQGGDLLVDAYCGAGFFARELREKFAKVVGIEWSADAIRWAREQAGEKETYLQGDVALYLVQALSSGAADATTLLLDPPSEGVDVSIINTILDRRPRRLIYVSCNPSTLARDIKRLGDAYRLIRAVPVDMFPQTAEIETVALLELA